MSDPQQNNPPPQPVDPGVAPAPAERPPPPAAEPRANRILAKPAAAPAKPVKRVQAGASEDAGRRREFFNEAMRETLAPLAGLLEKKINPILAALESIPTEVERISQYSFPAALDQPQNNTARSLALPQAAGAGEEWPQPPQRFLRPPGALPPGEFETVCSRCARCVDACPAHAIKLDPYKLTADGLPYISAVEQPCVVCDSLACMASCPTGALKLVDRLQINIGTARVDHTLCLRHNGEDCRLCVEACPITGPGAAPGENGSGDAILIHAESGRVRIRKNICVGCGLCESRCPTSPPAIRVEPYRARLDPIIA